ncbi:MAG: monothiol glutaredoxin, Grx4 family, partial [Alphaproteobacteria bacterium]
MSTDNPAHDFIGQTIAANPVVLFMKGVPDQPRCGFSALVV